MSLVEDLKKMTVVQLKIYAEDNSIDLYGCKTKNEILETILNFVPIEEFPNFEEKKKPERAPDADEKIAVFSSKNLHWTDVGDLKPGYNIITKEASEKWLTLKHVRIAKPEEVAKHYGVL